MIMARLPSARFVRALKALVILCPILTVVFAVLFTISLAINQKHELTDRKYPVGRNNRRKHQETLAEMVERTGICNYINTYKTHVINNTSINVVLDNGSKFVLNSTVISSCMDLIKLETRYFAPQKVKVSPYNHTFLVKGSNICDKDTEIIVLVHSLHTYYDRRKAIRETWGGAITRNKWPGGTKIGANIKLAFVLGIHKNKTVEESLKKEVDIYNDIIQGDFIEDYHNMTLKSLLGLKWISMYCNQVNYLVKSDDDMIINFPYLIDVLKQTNLTWGVMGPYNQGSKALKKGKWSIPHEKYPFYFYPPYESGSAYVISGDIIAPLYSLSEYVPHIFIDDVYITGILGKILKIRHVTHSGFAYWITRKPRECDLVKNKIITGTKMKPKDLWDMWVSLNKKPVC